MKRIDPSPGYRLLKKGEKILRTDEFTYNRGWNWQPVTHLMGKPMDKKKYWPIRRKLLV